MKFEQFTLTIFPFVIFAISMPHYAQAQEAAVIACTKNMQTAMKVSADIAFTECKKKSLADCIKTISDRKYVGLSIRKEGSENLIDLGGDDSRWLEGGAWQSLGCTGYLPGPQRITNTISSWNTNKHQWFRQAVCPQNFVELDQPIGIVDAKFMCENDAIPQRLKDVSAKLQTT
jgi:hypothetical protein